VIIDTSSAYIFTELKFHGSFSCKFHLYLKLILVHSKNGFIIAALKPTATYGFVTRFAAQWKLHYDRQQFGDAHVK
jgi:hypothetical protein